MKEVDENEIRKTSLNITLSGQLTYPTLQPQVQTAQLMPG
jgi:hypothetical protein